MWFSGFTPQLQASVAMFKDVNGVPQPLSDIGGIDELSGGSFPLTIWIDYMKGALTGEEKLEFPKRAGIGDDKVKTAAPTSTATATSDPTGTSTTTPTPDPIPTVPGPTTRPTVTVPGPKPTHTVGPTNSKPTAPPGQG